MAAIPPVTDEFSALIGQIIVRWSYLERTFNEFLKRSLLLNPVDTGRGLPWPNRSLDQRRRLFRRQARECFKSYPNIVTELIDIQSGLASVQTDRDLIAHGQIWLLWPVNVLQVQGRKSGKDVERFYPAPALEHIAAVATRLHFRLFHLMAEPDQSRWSSQELTALRDFVTRSHEESAR